MIKIYNSKKKKFLIVIPFLFYIAFSTNAQQVISSGGDFHQNSGGSVVFTIGEGISETFLNSNNILTQGFNQSKLSVSAIEDIKKVDYTINAFPNPTSDYIIIKLENKSYENMNYQIFDMQGKMLKHDMLIGAETKISFQNLPSSTYFIKIFEGDQAIKSFKIIKNN
jgi:hypothetical protein